MKKILLIGDSIRVGYDKYVKMAFEDSAEVVYPNENCRFASYVLRYLNIWASALNIGDDVDLVHWNAGLWDCLRMIDGKVHTDIEVYADYIERLCVCMPHYFPNAKFIFATSTPGGLNYDPNSHVLLTLERDDWNREIALYNDVVSAYLKNQGVRINDLYGFIYPNVAEFICEDGLHLSEAGVEAVAQKVAKEIRAMLAE